MSTLFGKDSQIHTVHLHESATNTLGHCALHWAQNKGTSTSMYYVYIWYMFSFQMNKFYLIKFNECAGHTKSLLHQCIAKRSYEISPIHIYNDKEQHLKQSRRV